MERNVATQTQNKILAVDDNPDSIAIMEELLGEDYDLKTASTGEEALEIALDFLPDIILLDIMMPGMNGYEVCQRLREHSALRDTNIIMVSAKVMPQDRLKGYDVGADDYITKPFENEELLAKVCIYLGLNCRLRETSKELFDAKQDLKGKNEVLEKTLGELEGRVEKRTRKLSKSNELLKKEIMERKQVEDALRSSKANLRKVITASPEGIIVLDKNGIINFANPAADSLFDRKSEELTGERFSFPIVLNKATEIEIVRQAGETAIAETHIVEIDWARQPAYLVSLHNITERKKAEEKIKEVTEIKTKFVSMASHELRTPLTAIKEGIRLVAQEKTGALNKEQKE
ncbi:MAG: response regulator, partial [Candidatus Micrarchaeota archaeon]